MSEIWEECERKLIELKEYLLERVNKGFSDEAVKKELEKIRSILEDKGKVVGNPEVDIFKIKKMIYLIPIEPANKNLEVILEIIVKDENVSELSKTTDCNGKIKKVSAYKNKENFLEVYFNNEKVYVECYKKEASTIVDKIVKEFKLY
jgi:uncharacterized protein with PIN domain